MATAATAAMAEAAATAEAVVTVEYAMVTILIAGQKVMPEAAVMAVTAALAA